MSTTVQKAIRDGMEATGITQTELAIVLRSRARASEIINGKRDLRRTELLVLSYLLHIPLETLIPPLSEEDKLHIDSLIAWERKLQETRYIKKELLNGVKKHVRRTDVATVPGVWRGNPQRTRSTPESIRRLVYTSVQNRPSR